MIKSNSCSFVVGVVGKGVGVSKALVGVFVFVIVDEFGELLQEIQNKIENSMIDNKNFFLCIKLIFLSFNHE